MTKLVHPWDLSQFQGGKGDPRDLDMIKSHLVDMGIGWATKKPASPKLLSALDKIVAILVEDKNLLVLSNSVKFLKSISNVIARIYCLTTELSATVVNTDYLIRTIISDTKLDPDSVNEMELLSKRGLIIWEDLQESSNGSSKFYSKFLSLLSDRIMNEKVSNLFLGYSKEHTAAGINSFFDLCSVSIGIGAIELIKEIKVKYFNIKNPSIRIEVENL